MCATLQNDPNLTAHLGGVAATVAVAMRIDEKVGCLLYINTGITLPSWPVDEYYSFHIMNPPIRRNLIANVVKWTIGYLKARQVELHSEKRMEYLQSSLLTRFWKSLGHGFSQLIKPGDQERPQAGPAREKPGSSGHRAVLPLLGVIRFSELDTASARQVELRSEKRMEYLQSSLPTRFWKSLGQVFSQLIKPGDQESESNSHAAHVNGDVITKFFEVHIEPSASIFPIDNLKVGFAVKVGSCELETPALLLTTCKGLPVFISPDLLPSLPSPDSRLLQFSPFQLPSYGFKRNAEIEKITIVYNGKVFDFDISAHKVHNILKIAVGFLLPQQTSQ
ncbi:unnamed protein product [Fraxinus pennsylvanica]|uniref:Tify domain-containing protein n=1 Tax=Fraxinus pennsylvanica TaxID=56036 RepID=A0AAD1Z7L5_9LAMI|nr:unnamed protein product [Fraxinus pennsylvanica]